MNGTQTQRNLIALQKIESVEAMICQCRSNCWGHHKWNLTNALNALLHCRQKRFQEASENAAAPYWHLYLYNNGAIRATGFQSAQMPLGRKWEKYLLSEKSTQRSVYSDFVVELRLGLQFEDTSTIAVLLLTRQFPVKMSKGVIAVLIVLLALQAYTQFTVDDNGGSCESSPSSEKNGEIWSRSTKIWRT